MSHLQVSLFQHIKNIMPANLSLVDEIADVLEISNDSAYRRIRGEKEISFEEIQKLSNRFKISIDQILNLKNDSMLFSGNFIHPDRFDFLKYLDDQYINLSYIEGFREKVVINFSKDIPFFYYYMFPEIAAFKSFAFMRTLLRFPAAQSKFSLKEIQHVFFEKVKKIAQVVCRIPFIEIMNVENILTTLRQIEYYKDTGVFATKEEVELIYKKLYEMIDHMENICAVGKKHMPGQKPLHADAVV